MEFHAKCFAFGIMLNLLAGRAQGDRFYIEGEVFSEDRIPLPKGVSPNAVTLFSVNLDGDNWRIQTERAGASYTIRADVGGTVSEIFSTLYLRPNDSTNWMFSSATARPGPVPYVVGDPMVQVLWVAFVSQCQFTNEGLRSLPKVFFPYPPNLNNAEFTLPMEVKRNTEPPYFLSSLVMFADGVWRSWEEERDAWVQPPLQRPLPAPYDRGFTNCVYIVREFGTTDMVTWPSKFSFVSYGMKNGAASSTDLDVVCSMDGRVTRCEPGATAATLIPEIPVGAPINEERFIWDKQPVFSFLYGSRGKWLSKDEAAALEEFKKQAQRQRLQKASIDSRPRKEGAKNQQSAKRRLVVVLTLLGISVLFPVILLLWSKRRPVLVNNG